MHPPSLTGVQRGEGLYGPLIVRKPEADELNKYFYDHDVPDHTFLVRVKFEGL